jgi:hypothetical protein
MAGPRHQGGVKKYDALQQPLFVLKYERFIIFGNGGKAHAFIGGKRMPDDV